MVTFGAVTPATWSMVGLVVFAGGLALVLGGLAWRRRDSPSAVPFAAMMAAAAVWLVAYAFQLMSPTAEAASFWFGVGTAILGGGLPLTWLWFCVSFAGVSDAVSRAKAAAVVLPASLVSLAFLTNSVHGLLWGPARLAVENGVSVLVPNFHLAYWVVVSLSFGLVFVSYLVLIKRFSEGGPLYRRQVLTILLAGIAPSVANFVYVTGAGPIPHLDLTPVGFVVEGLIVFVAVFRYRLFDLSPVARSRIVEQTADGTIVLDGNRQVVDCNPTAVTVATVQDPVGEPIEAVFPAPVASLVTDGSSEPARPSETDDSTGPVSTGDGGWEPETGSNGRGSGRTAGPTQTPDGSGVPTPTEAISATVSGTTRHFDPQVTSITDHRDQPLGTVILLRDVTGRVRRERNLASLRESSRDLMLAGSPAAVAELAVEAIREELDVPYASVYLREGDTLEPAAVTDAVTEAHDPPPSFPVGEGLIGEAYAAGESRVYRDVHAEPAPLVDENTPVRGAVILPLGDVGVLSAASDLPLDPDGSLVDFATILAGNTAAALDRARREQELRDRETELERQNDRLEQFASVVSHDLRNPISVADGWLDVLRENPDDEEALANVAASIDRMDALTDDLLDLARQGRAVSDREELVLAGVARDAWSHVETDGTSLSIRTGDDTVEADRGRLLQLFENCFRNAVEHGEAGAITVESVDSGGDDTAAGFAIADDGVGIPPDERDQVFEYGYSTGDGTGFGFPIVADVAEAHGWSVSIAESDAGGARVVVSGVTLVG